MVLFHNARLIAEVVAGSEKDWDPSLGVSCREIPLLIVIARSEARPNAFQENLSNRNLISVV